MPAPNGAPRARPLEGPFFRRQRTDLPRPPAGPPRATGGRRPAARWPPRPFARSPGQRAKSGAARGYCFGRRPGKLRSGANERGGWSSWHSRRGRSRGPRERHRRRSAISRQRIHVSQRAAAATAARVAGPGGCNASGARQLSGRLRDFGGRRTRSQVPSEDMIRAHAGTRAPRRALL